MRSSFRLVAVCFVVGCASKNGPRLETVKAEDEVEGMIKRRLNELRPCQAFTSFDRHFTKLARGETLDDLVKVTVTPDVDDEDKPHVTTGGPLADASCVARRVKAWPWPKDALPATFTYRFRATEAQLAALKAQHQAAFDAFCHELGSISESDLDGLLTAVVNANEKMKTSEDDVAQELVWGTTIALHARKDERARMVAGTVREIAEEFDLKGCRTVRGWSTLDIEEVLDSPGMPADGCAARVRQLRALADPPSRGLAPRASSPRAEPLPADGFLLDLASMNVDERRDAARLKALASAEAKKQRVALPVAYVVMPATCTRRRWSSSPRAGARHSSCAWSSLTNAPFPPWSRSKPGPRRSSCCDDGTRRHSGCSTTRTSGAARPTSTATARRCQRSPPSARSATA